MKDGYMSQYQDRNYAPKKNKLEKKDLVNQRNVNGSLRKEILVETHQQRQQRVQVPTERRPETQEENSFDQNEGQMMKKETIKHKKHEAKESKAYEKKEDKKEKKPKKK